MTVSQSGNVTNRHLAKWIADNTIADAGSATAGTITDLGLVNDGSIAVGLRSAIDTAGEYALFSMEMDTGAGQMILGLNSFNGAAELDLIFDINGTPYNFPGDLPTIPVSISEGGTGATVASVALTNLLPDQSGENGKALVTNGTTAAWTALAGGGTVTEIATGTGLTGGPITASGTIAFASVADGSLLANISGGAAAPTASTLTAILDDQIGTTEGYLIMRGAATWDAATLSEVLDAEVGSTQGSLIVRGATTWDELSVGTSGQALSGGTDPVWQAINGTQIRMGSDAQGDVLYFNGTNYARLGAGTSGEFLQTQGAGANPQWAAGGSGPTLGTPQATTSGTSFTFSSIPSGTTQIVVSLVGVSLSGTDDLLIQLGTGSGVETTGYTSTSSYLDDGVNPAGVSSTSGFIINTTLASQTYHGTVTLTLQSASANTWVASHTGRLVTNATVVGAGSKSLGAEADRVVLTRSGSNTFDAGSVNIQYQ